MRYPVAGLCKKRLRATYRNNYSFIFDETTIDRSRNAELRWRQNSSNQPKPSATEIVVGFQNEDIAQSDQGKMDVVVRRLREEAAKHGANGVLLQSRGEQSAGTVGTASGSATAYGNSAYGSAMGVGANIFYKVGSGIAIYVI